MSQLLLELRHYETVTAIVRFGTMTEAAKHLATSQSALSHRLAEAERRLGTALFDRGRHRRLTPTRAGLAIHQAADRALDDLARSEESVIRSAPTALKTVRIAVGSYDCYHWFPSFLRRVRQHLPDTDLELSVVGDAPGPALASHAVDIVLAPGQPVGNLDLRPLFEDELVFVAGPDHGLASKPVVEADDLVNETYLTYNAQPTPGFEYDRFIRPAQTYPQIVKVVRQTNAIIELVAAGAGVSILSRWALQPALDAGRVLASRCGDAGLPLTWHAAIRPSDALAAVIAQDLSDHLSRDTAAVAHHPVA